MELNILRCCPAPREEVSTVLQRFLDFFLTPMILLKGFIHGLYPEKKTYNSLSENPSQSRREKLLNRRLLASLIVTTQIIDYIATNMYSGGDDCRWQKTVLGQTIRMSRASCSDPNEGVKTIVSAFKSWLHSHEEAQVMLASVLVVVGLWWLVRTVLALLINLVCPILVVFLAVMCVPQLRVPLLGQNYPQLANILRNILMKMAENIQT